MRKALCVGIDCYEKIKDLHGCVNDANGVKAALERNGDGTLNFSTKLMCATSEASYISRTELKDAILELFDAESEIALLYYAGHGSYDALGGYLCTSEVKRADEGLSLDDVMGIVAQSKAQNKVIILDSCHSGFAASSKEMPNYSVLHNGTTILAACDEKQYSSEENGHGVFTTLLIEALYGGAMNLIEHSEFAKAKRIRITWLDNELGDMQRAFQAIREIMYNQDAEKKKQMLEDFSVYNKRGVDSAISLVNEGFFEGRELKAIAAEEVFDALIAKF